MRFYRIIGAEVTKTSIKCNQQHVTARIHCGMVEDIGGNFLSQGHGRLGRTPKGLGRGVSACHTSYFPGFEFGLRRRSIDGDPEVYASRATFLVVRDHIPRTWVLPCSRLKPYGLGASRVQRSICYSTVVQQVSPASKCLAVPLFNPSLLNLLHCDSYILFSRLGIWHCLHKAPNLFISFPPSAPSPLLCDCFVLARPLLRSLPPFLIHLCFALPFLRLCSPSSLIFASFSA